MERIKKEKIIEIVENLGLYVDFDQWDVNGKEWMRIEDLNFQDARPFIIYKDEIDSEKNLLQELRKYIMELGQISLKKNFSKLLTY